MELRHIRYFVAVAEAGSLSLAAEQTLHTSQPSLSRQIQDLEEEVGAQLLSRSARGVELTPAGRAFLDHSRSVLSQVDTAIEAVRRIARPAKPCFAMSFLTGQELLWMPEALRILRDALPDVDLMVTSQYSSQIAEGLSKGKTDVGFMRREADVPDLAFETLTREPLLFYLRSDHPLAALEAIGPEDIAGQPFLTVSRTAPVLRAAIADYLKRSGLEITSQHEVDHLTMAMSLIASTRGVSLLPAYGQNFLPWSVTTRPVKGETPTIELVLGYKKSNQSPILKLLLSRLNELSARVLKQNR